MIRLVIIVTIGIFLFTGCTLTIGKSGSSSLKQPTAQCTSDADCAVGGCSKQVCGKKGEVEKVITTCEYKEEYSCLLLTNCGCVSGTCKWRETLPYQTCLNRI